MGKRIGIDLGTTNSVVAVAAELEGDFERFGRVVVLADRYGRTTHASAICDCDGDVVFGEDAKDKAAEGYAPIRFWKRHMGRGVTFLLKGEELLPQALSRELLVYLKQIAATAMKEDVDGAVITHPAYFGGEAIAATREAGDQAELNVGEDGLMMEPIAAALAYLHDDPEPSKDLRVMVYDLGGGTFDITILQRRNGRFTPLAFGGDPELGGYNFDKALATHLLRHLQGQGYKISIDPDQPERDARWAALMHIAEEMKIDKLSRTGSGVIADIRRSRIFTDDDGNAVQLTLKVTRDDFESMIMPLIDRTVECCDDVLAKAKLSIDQVNRAIMVGGSSRLPIVQRRLAEHFGREFEIEEQMADLCVAIGAALYAGSGGVKGGFQLDWIPEETGDDEVIISGRVLPTDQMPDPSGCQVALDHDGDVENQVADEEGNLYFEVELSPDTENAFELRASAPDGAEVEPYRFTVIHRGGAGPADEGQPGDAAEDLGDVPTFLAKDLKVRTVDRGLVTVAREGRTLPVDVRVDFLATAGDENSEVTISLYQEDQHLVDIPLTNFTAPVPDGTPVDLTVHVGRDYSMHATAAIPQANATAEATDIKIPAPPRPSVDRLRAEFSRLQEQVRSAIQNMPPGTEKVRIGGEADRTVSEIEGLLDDPAPEVYRIQRLLRGLADLVERTAKTDLQPTRAAMGELFARARRLLPEAEEKDESLRAHDYGRTLDELWRSAETAYEKRDQSTWQAVAQNVGELCDTLQRAVQGSGGGGDLPQAPQLKMILDRMLVELESEAGRNGVLRNAPVQEALQQSRSELARVDVRSPNAQAELVAIYQGPITRLRELIGLPAPTEQEGGIRTVGLDS